MFRKYIIASSILILCGSMSMNARDDVQGQIRNESTGFRRRVSERLSKRVSESIMSMLPPEEQAALNARRNYRNIPLQDLLRDFAVRNRVLIAASLVSTCGTVYGNLTLEYISLMIAIFSLNKDIGIQNTLGIAFCLGVSFSGSCIGNMFMKYVPAVPSFYFTRQWFLNQYREAFIITHNA